MKWNIVVSNIVIAGLVGFGSTANAQFSFTKIADQSTAIPGGTGDFTNFANAPAISDGVVLFRAQGPSSQDGIYTGSGGSLDIVVDTHTPLPDGTGNFTGTDTMPTYSGGTAGFLGSGSESQQGIYSATGGVVTKLVNLSTPIPDGTGAFTAFGFGASAGGDSVAFRGVGASSAGIYSATASAVTLIADTNTAIPGGTGNFVNFTNGAANSGAAVAFVSSGSGGQQGVYVGSGGALTVIADKNTAVPDGTGVFTSFSPTLSMSGDTVAFRGASTGQSGIYTGAGGALSVVADLNTLIPGGTGAFTGFGVLPSISGDNVAFIGAGSGGQDGIYELENGVLTRVIGIGDTLGGITLSTVLLDSDGLSGSTVAFRAIFSDGSTGIYTATAVPEPSSFVLLGLSLAGFLCKRLRRPPPRGNA